MATRQEEIEKIAALVLGPLVEVAWADGHVTPGERAGVLEAARFWGSISAASSVARPYGVG